MNDVLLPLHYSHGCVEIICIVGTFPKPFARKESAKKNSCQVTEQLPLFIFYSKNINEEISIDRMHLPDFFSLNHCAKKFFIMFVYNSVGKMCSIIYWRRLLGNGIEHKQTRTKVILESFKN